MHTHAALLAYDGARGNNYSSKKPYRREGGGGGGGGGYGAPPSAWARGQQARRDSQRPPQRRRRDGEERGELEAMEEEDMRRQGRGGYAQRYDERRAPQQQYGGGDRRGHGRGYGDPSAASPEDADDGAADAREQRLTQSAAGKWFELEFVYGGPTRPFAILHKPAGLSVQGRYQADSVDKRLRLGYGASEVYFPHRLDKHTCGLLVVAFSRAASRALGASMERGQWEKKYRVMALVPPAVDMEHGAQAEGTQSQAQQQEEEGAVPAVSVAATTPAADAPPVLPFTARFPASAYPASSLISRYLVGSLWGADPLQSPSVATAAAEPGKGHSTDLAGSRTPVRIFLRQQATLRSYLARRPLPLYKRIDEASEWDKWNRAIRALPANRAQLSASSADPVATTGVFVAASPSRDGSAGVDRRRLHPFVPETMLYESVPFRVMDPPTGAGPGQGKSTHRTRKGQEERPGADADDVDEAEMDAAEIAAAADSSAATGTASTASQDVPKKSVTEFTLLDSNPTRRLALYDVKLHTGRSHQIRIHCADAGMPVLNDPYYNSYSVYTWMREAARMRTEDALAKQMRAQGRVRGPLTTEAVAQAVDNAEAQDGGAALPVSFPAPAIEPMRPPSLPLRTGALPQTLRSGTRVSFSRGTIAPTNKRAGANNNSNPALERQQHRKYAAGGASAEKKAARAKYANRAPRQSRAFATVSRALLAARLGPLLADSSYTSSFSSRAARGASRSSTGSSRHKTRKDARGPVDDDGGADENVLRPGRSSVGQGGAIRGGRRVDVPDEHEEFDDESERRVIRPRGTGAHKAKTTGGQQPQQQQQQQQKQQSKPSRPSGPRIPAWQRAQNEARANEDERVQFEHHLSYGGRKKPVKQRKDDEDEEGLHNRKQSQSRQQVGQSGPSVRYTNRHDAPKRPHWLPEHVPYRLVAPNPAVAQQWGSVLGSYGVTTAGDKDAQAEEKEREQMQETQPFTAAKRYEGVERGAGAVGWLVKAATSSSAVPLSEPTPADAASASATSGGAGGDNQWFSTQVSRPEHEMTLQAYYLRIPHPFKPDEIITCTQALPRHWEKLMQSGDGKPPRK